MFKKRERAKNGVSSSRQSSVHIPVIVSQKSHTQTSSARVTKVRKLSVSDLQERYADRDVESTKGKLEPIDDVWEDEQLRKLGINLHRPAITKENGDLFGQVRSRVEERLRQLKSELELSLEKEKTT